MLKKMFMINSAETEYIEIAVDSNLFFGGDNGSGKTTTIRALHYLFVTDSRYVGISGDQTPFNDYYFPEQQSYLVYDFDSFFIIMFRNQYKLYKYFSKLKLDIKRFYDDNDTLKPHIEILKYIKIGDSKKVETNKDFRSIFYGQNSSYKQFTFNQIGNFETFIKLYSKLFNISKIIVDSNSIKEAIKDSIGQEDSYFEFDTPSFYNSFYELKYLNRFYETYEKNLPKIDKQMILYKEIINLEDMKQKLLGEMKYRYSYEQEEYNELKEQLSKLKELIDTKKIFIKNIEKKEEYIGKKCRENINDFERNLQEIKNIEIEFSETILLKNKNIVSKKDTLQIQQKQTQKSIIELEGKFRNILETIENEILQIKQSIKSEELQLKEQIHLLKEQSNRQINKEYENHQLEKTKNQEKINSTIKLHQQIILKYEKSKDDVILEKEELSNNYDKKFDLLREKLENDNRVHTSEIRKLNQKREETSNAINRYKREKEEINNDFQKSKKKSKELYNSERDTILKKQSYLEGLFDVDEHSFQAFLNDNIDEWETKLYPVMEKALLTMDKDTLNPKIIDDENLFGIEIKTDSLKTLPSRQEIEMDLEEISNQLKILEKSYNLEIRKQEKKNREENQEIDSKILKLTDSLSISLSKIKEEDEKQKKLSNTYHTDKNRLTQERDKAKQEVDKNIESIKKEILEVQQEIKKLYQKIKTDNQKYSAQFEEYKNKEKKILNTNIINLEKKYQSKIDLINNKITKLKESKNNTTNNKKLKELNIELKTIDKELTIVTESELFLKRYREIKEKLDTKITLQRKLLKNKQFQEKVIELFNSKKENIETYIKQQKKIEEKITNKFNLYKNGIERFEKLKLELGNRVIGSDIYLDEIVDKYLRNRESHLSKMLNFKKDFEILWRALKKFNRLDLPLNLEQFASLETLKGDKNIDKSIHELYTYQEKIEVEKRNSHLELKRVLTHSKLRLENFNTSGKKLQSKITKINNSLKKIDFSVVNSIRLSREDSSGTDAGSMLIELKNILANLHINEEKSLFNNDLQAKQDIDKIIDLLDKIKKILGTNRLSSYDGSRVYIEYRENNKSIKRVDQLQSQASTGTNLLLKVAIIISILGEYILDSKSPFYLIIDEVSQLHSKNQDKMREFAKENGFHIVFVAPEPTLISPKDIRYYVFEKNRATLMNLV